MAKKGGGVSALTSDERAFKAIFSAIQKTLEDPETRSLFGAPVDIELLPDYASIIEKPRDLQTISDELESSQRGEGPYTSYKEPLADVNLVWLNCLRYNNRPEDDFIVKICNTSRALFGAALVEACKESEVTLGWEPDRNLLIWGRAGDEAMELPLRTLNDFEICCTKKEPVDLLQLAQKGRSSGDAVLSGTMIGECSGRVEGEKIVDYVIDRSTGFASVLLCTDIAWYRLESPAGAYAETFQNVAQVLQLVDLAMGLLQSIDEYAEDIKNTVNEASKQLKSVQKTSKRKINVPGHVKKFATSCVQAHYRREKINKLSGAAADDDDDDQDFEMDLDAVSDEDMPDDFEAQDDDFEMHDLHGEEAQAAKKRAWRRVKYKRRKVSSGPKWDAKAFASDQEADRSRGEPPQMLKGFRIPTEKIHDVLFLWSFIQEFGDILRLPPITFSSLEAALCPGPSVAITLEEYNEAPELDSKENQDVSEAKPVKSENRDNNTSEIDTKGTNAEVKKEEDPDVCDDEPMESGLTKANANQNESEAAKERSKTPDEKSCVNDTKEGSEALNITSSSMERHLPAKVENSAPTATESETKAPADTVAPAAINTNIENTEIQGTLSTVPVKRGRGRPRKDGSAPQPRPAALKVAPQNIILDPTIRTRRQRGVTVTSRKLEEYALDIDDIFNDEDYQLPKQRRKMHRPYVQRVQIQSSIYRDNGHNEIAEALKQTQRMQEEYEASIREKYGVSSNIIKKGSPLDRPYSASGVLLRDIVLALLGVIDATLPQPKSDAKRPVTASAYVNKVQKAPWTEEAANNVWSWAGVWNEAKEASLRLAYGDFIDLTASERIDILSALLYEAIESKFLSGEIAKRADKYSQQMAGQSPFKCRQPHGADTKSEILSRVETEMNEEDSTSLSSSKNVKEWVAWCNVLGLGTKCHIGEDFRGRRYWALGRESGAFRVFCQEVQDHQNAGETVELDSWGWYEGVKLDELIAWLKQSDIKSERFLVAALSSAPSPTTSPTPSMPARKLNRNELEAQRSDGYKNINQPLLRGEWNLCQGRPAPSTIDQRASQALESILGSISFWFKDSAYPKKIYGILDIILTCQPRDCARALLETDRLLIEEEKVNQEWIDVWSPKWRTEVASTTDIRDITLQIAALQSHVIMQADVIPRGTYMKILDDLNCIMNIPLPSDNIAVMRKGVIKHIDKGMSLLGLGSVATKISLASSSTAHDASTTPAAVQEDGKLHTVLPLKDTSIEIVKSQWLSIRQNVLKMKHIERYTVRGIVYRRHLADSIHVDTEGFTNEEIAIYRRPVAWMYLKPVEHGPRQQLADQCICIPIVLDPSLEDCHMPLETFKLRSKVTWLPNDRFKLFMPPTPSQRRSKNTGYWKKGTVIDNMSLSHDDPYQALDPWESIVVEFDNSPMGETNKISPWKMEVDPDEERRMLEEARKMEQTVARAQRARSSMRSSDEMEAAIQEAEWAEEDLQLENARKQAKRSEELLRCIESAMVIEPGAVQNDSMFSPEARESYRRYLSELGSEIYGKYAAFASLASKSRSKNDSRSGPSTYPTGPLVPGQQVDHRILEALRALSREQFMTMVTNFYVGLKGKYKVPIFAHRELDLYTVWWSVMDRFGYEAVSAEKQWKDVCRSLNLDLSGQTSASFNMRLNYERCLLDFENYLACGQYEADLADNKAPVHTHAMNPATTRFTIPGAYEDQLAYSDSHTTPTVPAMLAEESSAKLQDLVSPPESGATHPPVIDQGEKKILVLKIPLKVHSTASETTPKSTVIKLKPSNTPKQASYASVGQEIQSLQHGAIGKTVQLYWPSEGGWWTAEIVDYDPSSTSHQLVYNKGTTEESFEWVNLGSLSQDEIRHL